jgi:WD40 repeat protein
VFSLAFSPDSQLLASTSCDQTVKVWGLASGRRLGSFSGIPDEGRDSALSPDGRTLAVGVGTYKPGVPASDGAIVLYDVATGSELRRLTGHTDRVDSLVFSPDGKFIASGSADGDRTIRLWGIYP